MNIIISGLCILAVVYAALQFKKGFKNIKKGDCVSGCQGCSHSQNCEDKNIQ